MDGSHEMQRTPDLVAGPKPTAPAAGAMWGRLERFGTPLWIAVGISVIVLAVLCAVS